MNHLREAAQQALEALEKTHTQPGCEQWQAERKASVALRAALAQQEPKPFGYIWPTGRHPEFRYTQLYTAPPRRETEQGQPEPEPVAYTSDVSRRMREAGMTFHLGMPHAAVMEQMTRFHDLVCAEASIKAAAAFATPPRREWRNLTMQEIGDVFHAARNAKLGANQDNSRPRLAVVEIARAVEAALKEKNNA